MGGINTVNVSSRIDQNIDRIVLIAQLFERILDRQEVAMCLMCIIIKSESLIDLIFWSKELFLIPERKQPWVIFIISSLYFSYLCYNVTAIAIGKVKQSIKKGNTYFQKPFWSGKARFNLRDKFVLYSIGMIESTLCIKFIPNVSPALFFAALNNG